MLTVEQCKRLKEAGLKPSDKYQGSFFHRAVGQDIEPYIYHPTVEDMMGWMRCKYKPSGVDLGVYEPPGIPNENLFRAWSFGGKVGTVDSDCFPDAPSALYNLFEKLEGCTREVYDDELPDKNEEGDK